MSPLSTGGKIKRRRRRERRGRQDESFLSPPLLEALRDGRRRVSSCFALHVSLSQLTPLSVLSPNFTTVGAQPLPCGLQHGAGRRLVRPSAYRGSEKAIIQK